MVVVSPGVPEPVWAPLADKGIPVWGEMELGFRVLSLAGRWPKRSLAVTGTNGKTTTTAFLGAIFKTAGARTVVAGNIGTPLCAVVDKIHPSTALVLEISSYQLESCFAFRSAAGAILNVTPDHLGRHGTMDRYAQAKFRLFQNADASNIAVLNADDPWCRRGGRGLAASTAWFGRRGDLRVQGRRLVSRQPNLKGAWPLPRFLAGRHNMENVLAAVGCARFLGIPPSAVARALRNFRGVEHRLEEARRWRGIRFVNDSKATNVDSTLVALKAMPGPLRVILGGEHKGSPYTPLKPWLKKKAKEILLIGEAAPLIGKDLRGAAPMSDCGTLARAVARAAQTAVPGDTVLLSPACASFDQFNDFEHRGRVFKDLVGALA